ncbi:MAG: hypothetical protein ACUVQ6_06830 [Dissulfurimicrobium sp.]|uniref:hypothetical protein n=1 Tax=Dissulfurimicrobium sp. TaxID=2022436 RepID=UPI0040496360
MLGIDHPINKKIEWAQKKIEAFGPMILEDEEISRLIEIYRAAIKNTRSAMSDAGVTALCTHCAVNDGGSCCGAGIENRFDATLLLINLLMGSSLPTARFYTAGCMFLGEKGCLIEARQLICVNYICQRLEEQIDKEALLHLKERIGEEAYAGFTLEETLKMWLKRHEL